MAHVVVTRDMHAPSQRVFDALADQEGMSRWMPGRVRVVTTGPDGLVGTVRRMSVGVVTFDERIVESDARSTFTYQLVRGVPFLARHRGIVSVQALAPTQSRVTWDIDFQLKVPIVSHIVLWFIAIGVRLALAKLASQLEAVSR